MDITVTINGKDFKAELFDNPSAEAFASLLPLSFEMEELNGNEKCRYISKRLPVEPQAVGKIEAGDLMLFGPSCFVIFYDSFPTTYSYTPIGRIIDPEGLKKAAGKWDANVSVKKA